MTRSHPEFLFEHTADDPEGLLLIDEWTDQAALDRYHASPMMQEAAALREKYKLDGRQIRRYQAMTEPVSRAVQPRPLLKRQRLRHLITVFL